MAWVRIHDGALSHHKIAPIFDPRHPFDLWIWGLSYCQMHLTNGYISTDALPRGYGQKAVNVLVQRNLWEVATNGYAVHDYLGWNDSRTVVQDRQQKSKDRLDRWKKKQNEGAPLETYLETRSERVSNGVRNATSTKPNQTKPNKEEEQERPRLHARTGSGVLVGSLPREHLRHAVCGRVCLHESQFQQFARKLGGLGPDHAVRVWAEGVLELWDSEKQNEPIGGTDFQFWDTRWVEWRGMPKASSIPEPDTAAEDARVLELLKQKAEARR